MNDVTVPAVLTDEFPWPGDTDLAVQQHRFENVVREAAQRLARRLPAGQWIEVGRGYQRDRFYVMDVSWRLRRGLRRRTVTSPVLMIQGYDGGCPRSTLQPLTDPRRREIINGQVWKPGGFVGLNAELQEWKLASEYHQRRFLSRAGELVRLAEQQGAQLRKLVDSSLGALNA